MTKRFTFRHAALALAVALFCAFVGAGVAYAASSPAPMKSAAPAEQSQPQMQSALNYLHQALQALNSAKPDKGGHRNQAINAVQEAINQVKAGMKSAP
ncbi:MAG TPA: hypothetical protein VMU38_06995 [Candidatus Binatia bacterium]|nr:hypothetical protein [Candidatus Binatia bacterium]